MSFWDLKETLKRKLNEDTIFNKQTVLSICYIHFKPEPGTFLFNILNVTKNMIWATSKNDLWLSFTYSCYNILVYSRNCVSNVNKEFARKGTLMVYLPNVNKHIKRVSLTQGCPLTSLVTFTKMFKVWTDNEENNIKYVHSWTKWA